MDYSKRCRCCLGEFSQDNQICTNQYIMDMYLFCIQLNYKYLHGEEIPKYFCSKCRDKIKSTYLFIRNAKHCNKKLLQAVFENRAQKNSDESNNDINTVTGVYNNQNTSVRFNEDIKPNIEQVIVSVDPNQVIDDEDVKPIFRNDEIKPVNHDNCQITVGGKNQELLNLPGTSKKNNTNFIKVIPKSESTNDTDKLQITVPLRKEQMKQWFITIEPKSTNDNKSTLTLNSNVTKDGNLSRKKTLHQHIETTPSEDPGFVCCLCKMAFKSKTAINDHMDMHLAKRKDSIFKCDMCGKEFPLRRYMIKHLATHSDQRPFKCDLCQKTFKRDETLKTHMNLHKIRETGQKPYSCDVCNKRFACRGTLTVHAKVHLKVKPKPFKCNLCEKSFGSKHALELHGITHSDDSYPALCTLCGKRFRTDYYLENHMRWHAGEKIHACGSCDYRAFHASSLRRHEAKKHENKQYQCPHCPKMFNFRPDMTGHMRLHKKKANNSKQTIQLPRPMETQEVYTGTQNADNVQLISD